MFRNLWYTPFFFLIFFSSYFHTGNNVASVYIVGIFSNTIQGIEGGIILGLAHGLVSPGLFICAGLGILVAFYRLNSSLNLSCLSHRHITYSKNVNKFSSKRIARCYSTMAKNNDTTNQSRNYSMDPWFITGLFDAESCFVVTILKNSRYKTGWNVQARVQIKMHEKDRVLIKSIQ